MEKVVTNTVRTLAFCISSANTKSRVHFFPAAGISSGPYPIFCKLTLFGKGVERKSVMLDGGRLGQPDGLRLEDAFPTLRSEQSGMFGLEIELSCPQQSRINLLPSQCFIDLVGPQYSIQYSAAPFIPTKAEASEVSGYSMASEVVSSVRRRPRIGIGMHDAYLVTSLVSVNSEKNPLRPELWKVANSKVSSLQVGTVAAESALEVPLDDFLFRESQPQEASWGLMRTEGVFLSEIPNDNIAFYMLYRDSQGRKPVSVCAI